MRHLARIPASPLNIGSDKPSHHGMEAVNGRHVEMKTSKKMKRGHMSRAQKDLALLNRIGETGIVNLEKAKDGKWARAETRNQTKKHRPFPPINLLLEKTYPRKMRMRAIGIGEEINRSGRLRRVEKNLCSESVIAFFSYSP